MDNQILFDLAFSQYSCEPAVLSMIAVGKTLYEVDLSPTIARKVLEWYFSKYVDEIEESEWDQELLSQVLEEFTEAHAKQPLEKVL